MRLVAISLLALLVALPAADARNTGGGPVALVTAETMNELLAVGLPSGHVLRRLGMPADPQNLVVCARQVAVVSTRAGAVTLLDPVTLKVRRVLRGFGAPHLAACSPSGDDVYVTDDKRGQLAVIGQRVLAKIFVGWGAHHLSFSPDQPRLWIALGERAHTIAVVDTTHPARPALIGDLDPHGLAHDLGFTPDGRRVWVTSDVAPTISILDAVNGRLLGTVYGGAPPQHVAFGPAGRAYVTSGAEGLLRIVSIRSGRTERVVRMPPGSFNVTSFGGFVVSSSLTNGTLTELSDSGRVLLRERLAPAARDVAVATLP